MSLDAQTSDSEHRHRLSDRMVIANELPPLTWFQTENPIVTSYKILLSRGYLVEIADKSQLRLSDNALVRRRLAPESDLAYHSDTITDDQHLAKALKQLNIGSIDDERQITIHRKWTEEDLTTLFPPDHVRKETQYFEYHCNWSSAVRPCGRKVRLSYLDSHIALLAKALSAIGVGTSAACHNYYHGAYIQLCSPFEANWLQVVLRELELRDQIQGTWRVINPSWHRPMTQKQRSHEWTQATQNFMILRIEDHDWSEVFKVGMLLYENRFALRNHKSALVSLLEPSGLPEFPLLRSEGARDKDRTFPEHQTPDLFDREQSIVDSPPSPNLSNFLRVDDHRLSDESHQLVQNWLATIPLNSKNNAL